MVANLKKGNLPQNTRLTNTEEKALLRYIDRLDYANLVPRPELIKDAANFILFMKTSKAEQDNPPSVGKHWTIRFICRHSLLKRVQNTLDSDREALEIWKKIEKYFQKLQEVCIKYGIGPDDIWNMDETGFRIGVGKSQIVCHEMQEDSLFESSRES